MQIRLKKLVKEPLMQFFAAALVLFSLYGWTAAPEKDTIQVTSDIVERLVAARSELLGRPISHAERQALIDHFIEEEILLREAYRQGLDQRDGKVRQRLIDKMRFLIADEPAEPTRLQLRSFYRTNPDRYRTSPTVSFEHVFYGRKSNHLPQDDASVLVRLQAGADPESMGEPYWLGTRIEKISKQELLLFWGSEFSQKLFTLNPYQWYGPVDSVRGTHFVKIIETNQSVLLPYDDVTSAVKQDWLATRQRAIQEQRIADMGKRYRVEINTKG